LADAPPRCRKCGGLWFPDPEGLACHSCGRRWRVVECLRVLRGGRYQRMR
jgi:hypothetical protein